MKSGLLQTGVGPYLERSDHKQRQTSVSRLRRVTAHRQILSPCSRMSEVHEIQTGIGPYLERSDHSIGELELRFEVGSSTVANT
jgi:hypothetical protein